MKIRVLYEENIKNGHKFYTTIDIPDDDYSIMLDIDYEQRLAEAKPEKKAEVKRCETVQEMLDLMNSKEYNNWRRFHRHLGDPKTPYRKDDESEDETDVMDTIADDSQEAERNRLYEYEDICQWRYIRHLVKRKIGRICSSQYALMAYQSVNMLALSMLTKITSAKS